MLGVVLAGGHSTRLPNKVILPIRQSLDSPVTLPMFTIAYSMAKYIAGNATILAPPPELAARTVIDKYARFFDCDVYTDNFSGILGAISFIGDLAWKKGEAWVVIFCGDNLYCEEKYSFPDPLNSKHGLAVVREVPSERCAELDGWDDSSGWVSRKEKYTHALTTPWFLSREACISAKDFSSLQEFFNFMSIRPILMPLNGWCDLGTVSAYQAHWSHECSRP